MNISKMNIVNLYSHLFYMDESENCYYIKSNTNRYQNKSLSYNNKEGNLEFTFKIDIY
jgi:hypothetical protein